MSTRILKYDIRLIKLTTTTYTAWRMVNSILSYYFFSTSCQVQRMFTLHPSLFFIYSQPAVCPSLNVISLISPGSVIRAGVRPDSMFIPKSTHIHVFFFVFFLKLLPLSSQDKSLCAEKNKHSWLWKYLFWLS